MTVQKPKFTFHFFSLMFAAILFGGLISFSNCGSEKTTEKPQQGAHNDGNDDSGDDDSDNEGTVAPVPMVSVWQTTAENQSITLPLRSGFEYNMTVDWGDESEVQEITSWNDPDRTHNYTMPGEHTITLTGLAQAWYFNGEGDKSKILSVTDLGDMGWISFEKAFLGCNNLISVAGGKTSSVTDMSLMFYALLDNPLDLDVADWDTQNVTSMKQMFSLTKSNPDVSGWNTSNVTDMSFMFLNAALAKPDVSNWDTSNVTNMEGVFSFATISNPNLANWNFSSAENMKSFVAGTALTDANYSNLLNRIVQTNSTLMDVSSFNVDAKYIELVAGPARNILVSRGWNINDDGPTP